MLTSSTCSTRAYCGPAARSCLKPSTLSGVPFGVDFDAAVGEVADVADDLMARGDALREEAKTDALHLPADQIVPRHFHLCRNPLTAELGKRQLARETALS